MVNFGPLAAEIGTGVWGTHTNLNEFRFLAALLHGTPAVVVRWCNGKAFGLAISKSRVQILLEATLRNNLRQVVYTYVPLLPSSITWYRPKGGDALRLGR